MNTLLPLSMPHRIEVPFVKAVFGGVEFGLKDQKNPVTGVISSDFITSLVVEKYGSGAVNTYTLTMVFVITPEVDPNYIDRVISKASDRNITFTYGDLSQPEYSYKNEKAIITNIVPNVDYKNAKITYTITATSSTTLNYTTKKTFSTRVAQPSQVILEVLYDTSNGILEILPGMLNRDEVLSKGWIPQNDIPVQISEKKDIFPIDYILYLVSLMKGTSGEFYTLKVFDALNEQQIPHFEIISTTHKGSSQMMTIQIGFPGSIPVYDFSVNQDSSIALLVDYRDNLESGLFQDFSFNGDLITKDYYTSQVNNGSPSENMKNWWDKMVSFPLKASLTTQGLYVPADIVQSVYLDIVFFGKRYNHTGEYLIMEQKDQITAQGYRTTLSLLRIGDTE